MASAAAVFAGKAMATSIISNIVNKAFDYLMDNHKAGGLKSARERLLPQIEVVFDAVDTEEIRDQSRALDAWLWQLRDAVEEAEDALDELDYYRLEKEVKKEQDNKVRKYKRKVIQGFSRAFNLGSLERLRNSVKTLDDVVAGVERFFQISHAKRLRTLLMHFEDQDEVEQVHMLSKVHVPAPTLQRLHYLVFPVLNLWLMEHESDPETLISCYHWYPKGK
ncbi:hypothetical protein ZWY2020_051959 [Hordeum vulgare]|nr:hypothetical protein ZWY2020_051959 [Hordeum vulgare]